VTTGATSERRAEPGFATPSSHHRRGIQTTVTYHAVPIHSQAITSFVHYVTWHWKRALGRRSQKGHVTWTRIAPIAARWLPPARV